MDERVCNLSMLERFHGHRMNKRKGIQGAGQMRGTLCSQPIRHASMHLMLKVANEKSKRKKKKKQKRKVKQEKRPTAKGILTTKLVSGLPSDSDSRRHAPRLHQASLKALYQVVAMMRASAPILRYQRRTCSGPPRPSGRKISERPPRLAQTKLSTAELLSEQPVLAVPRCSDWFSKREATSA